MILASAWEVVTQEFGDLPTVDEWIRVAIRLVTAMLLGGVLGWQREHEHKPAGIRTHMLVALGAAVLVLVSQRAGMASADLSRVIQGIVTGIGFIGGGAILKPQEAKTVHGLTTAAGLWVTTAVGITVGLGRLWTACAVALATFLVLSVFGWIEYRFLENKAPD
jgi:putative Mg2+ transporter-C (MgtC) family protein